MVLPESIATTKGRLIPPEELELLEDEEELELDELLLLLEDELELLEEELELLELLLELLLEEAAGAAPQPTKALDTIAAANQPNG